MSAEGLAQLTTAHCAGGITEMVENGVIPLAFFGTTVLLWAVTIVYLHRLGRKFIRKYPETASREIPYAFQHTAHPEKALYFFRCRTGEFLRNDVELSNQRRWLIRLAVLSLVLPLAGFAALFAYAVVHR